MGSEEGWPHQATIIVQFDRTAAAEIDGPCLDHGARAKIVARERAGGIALGEQKLGQMLLFATENGVSLYTAEFVAKDVANGCTLAAAIGVGAGSTTSTPVMFSYRR